MADISRLLKYHFQKLSHNNWDTFEFLMQQLLVRLELWKYMWKTGQWPPKADQDEYSAWEEGCEKARAEIVLHVTTEAMHIVRACEDPAVIWENFKTTLGSRGWTT